MLFKKINKKIKKLMNIVRFLQNDIIKRVFYLNKEKIQDVIIL